MDFFEISNSLLSPSLTDARPAIKNGKEKGHKAF